MIFVVLRCIKFYSCDRRNAGSVLQAPCYLIALHGVSWPLELFVRLKVAGDILVITDYDVVFALHNIFLTERNQQKW